MILCGMAYSSYQISEGFGVVDKNETKNDVQWRNRQNINNYTKIKF